MAAKKGVKINRKPLFSYQNHGYSIKRLTFVEDCPCSSTDRIEVPKRMFFQTRAKVVKFRFIVNKKRKL